MVKSNQYVLGFAFNPQLTEVVLIEKNKPDWQKGFLNGVGGKVEEGETDFEAMVREFEEETGIRTEEWKYFCRMVGDWRLDMDWDVHCYACVLPDIGSIKTTTDEIVGIYKVLRLPENTLPSVRYLVPMALDPKVGSADIAYTERGVTHKSVHDIEKSRIISMNKGKL